MSRTAISPTLLRVSRIMRMKVKAMIAIIEQDGWQLRGFTGSHRQYVHAVKPGKVTIPGRPSADLHPKTAASILQQAGLEK